MEIADVASERAQSGEASAHCANPRLPPPLRTLQLPLLHLISALQLVELKNGEAYNGRMEACDTWMNMHLHEVICTAKDGEKFWRMKEVYIRGNTIKYVRVPDDTLGKAVEEKSRRAGAGSPQTTAPLFSVHI